MQTRRIYDTLLNPDGSAVVGAKVFARLVGVDTDLNGIVAEREVETVSGSDGSFALQLWPTARGSKRSVYEVSARHPVTGRFILNREQISVPDNDAVLRSLLNLPQGKPVDPALLQLASVSAFVTRAEDARTAAESARDQSVSAKDAAIAAADEAAGAKTAVKQSETAAAGSAQDAGDAKAAAVAAQGVAESKATAAVDAANAVAADRSAIELLKNAAVAAADAAEARGADVDDAVAQIQGAVEATQRDAQQALISRNAAFNASVETAKHAAATGADRLAVDNALDDAEQKALAAASSANDAGQQRALAVQVKDDVQQLKASVEQLRDAVAADRSATESARDDANATAEGYAGQLAQMATDILAVEQMILQNHG